MHVKRRKERFQTSGSHLNETVAHNEKSFEQYTLLDREPMDWITDEDRNMSTFWNAAYETGSSIENRLKLKSVGGR